MAKVFGVSNEADDEDVFSEMEEGDYPLLYKLADTLGLLTDGEDDGAAPTAGGGSRPVTRGDRPAERPPAPVAAGGTPAGAGGGDAGSRIAETLVTEGVRLAAGAIRGATGGGT